MTATELPTIQAARYECDSCGLCCKHLIIEIQELDLIREPRLMEVSIPFKVPEGMTLVDDDGEEVPEIIPGWGAGACLAPGKGPGLGCGMLGEDNRCKVYPTRPNCCVGFQAGSEKCQELREMYRLQPLQRRVE